MVKLTKTEYADVLIRLAAREPFADIARMYRLSCGEVSRIAFRAVCRGDLPPFGEVYRRSLKEKPAP